MCLFIGRYRSALVRRLQHPASGASTLLAGLGSGGLLLVQKGQGGAGRPNPGQWDPEDDLGMGHPKHRR